jgi:diketogulonate reductase-like aldo/keto reductase
LVETRFRSAAARRDRRKYGKGASQVALRRLIEQDSVAAIPKASNRAHMIENLAALDFALKPEDHAAIDR